MSLHRCTVVSVALPAIRSHCRRCRASQRFVCAERFRANSNGKLVDIWLIYRCGRCDATRNITVVERTPVHRVDPVVFDAASANDASTARRLARDVSLLRQSGVALDGGDAWEIEAVPAPLGPGLVLMFPEPLLVRLDAVVAAALGCSRRTVRDRVSVVGDSRRLDTLRLWGTVELRQLGQ